MTYYHNLPFSAARTLALSELMYNPEENATEYTFEGRDVGAGDDEEIVVMYVRRKKRPTHPLFSGLREAWATMTEKVVT